MAGNFYSSDIITIGHDSARTHLKGFDGVVVGDLDGHHIIDGDRDLNIVLFLEGHVVVLSAG